MTSIALPTQPSMSESEISCFKSHLQDAKVYLEFGCGGSTTLVAQIRIPKVYSVESDRSWADAMRSSPLIKPLVEAGSYLIKWVDIGPTKAWGEPADLANVLKWPLYSTAIWNEITTMPDFVLVDGRFRVSCALQTIARCPDATTIAVHDFQRTIYQKYILRYTDIVEQVQNLVILRRRADIDPRQFAIDCADTLLNTE